MSLNIKKARNGSALIMTIFLSIVGLLTGISVMTMATTNTNLISDNRLGTMAYYACEAGLEEVNNFFNKDSSQMGTSLTSLALPKENSSYQLNNGSTYWVNSINYQNSNTTAIVEVVGKYKDAYRKIKAKLEMSIPSVFDDYGLLTDGVLTIHGSKVLQMSVHGNGGLNLSGEDIMQNNAVATQSNDPTAAAPHSLYNPVGGYIPEIYVPTIPISDLRTQSKSNGILLNITQSDLNSQINSAPDGSFIYVACNPNIKDNIITLSGDMDGKTIFLDGSVEVNIDGVQNLSNATIITAGAMVVNGSVDIGTSHEGKLDVLFAAGDNVTLNGSRNFQSVFWSNGKFTQNGASLSGRVIAQEAIFLNGSFVLTNSNKLDNKEIFDRVVAVSTWQFVPAF